MKVTAIPAQITTVEDHIAANLNLTQMFLLACPLFSAALIFFILPPFGRYSLYKLIMAFILAGGSSSLAIRLNDVIILDLIKLRARYGLRAHTYVYRPPVDLTSGPMISPSQVFKSATHYKLPVIKVSSQAKQSSQRLLSSHHHQVTFKTKAGGLSVKVSAI